MKTIRIAKTAVIATAASLLALLFTAGTASARNGDFESYSNTYSVQQQMKETSQQNKDMQQPMPPQHADTKDNAAMDKVTN